MLKHLIKLCLLLSPFMANTSQALCFCGFNDWLVSGFYVGAFGGINGGYNLDCSNIRTNRGYYFGVNGGKHLFSNVRVETDVIWQENEVQSFSVGNIALTNVDGAIKTGSIMANAIYDFNFPFPGSPSLGAGVGYAWAGGSWSGDLTTTSATTNITTIRHRRSSFDKKGIAWQIIADLNFFVCQDIKLSIEYRFFKLGCHITNHKFGLSLAKFF